MSEISYNTPTLEILKTDIFDKWLTKVESQQTKAIIVDHITRMKGGNLGNTRSVGKRVFEKKINYARGFRLYYFFKKENTIILLNGGDKSTQSTDIEKAKNIKKNLV